MSDLDSSTTKDQLPCEICGNLTWVEIKSASGETYKRCQRCRYHVQEKFGDSQISFEQAQSKYYEGGFPHSTALSSYLNGQRQVRRIKLLKKYVANGRLIEVGPGEGQMLADATKCGYEIVAVEHSSLIAKELEEQFGIQVFSGEFENLSLTDNSFDAFLSFHVIEHVADVHNHIKKAARVVKPGGIALIATPCVNSWEHNTPFGLSPNYSSAHLQLFSTKSLVMLLQKHGWEPVRIYTPSYAEYWARVATSVIRAVKSKLGGQTIERGVFTKSSGKKIRMHLAFMRSIGVITFFPRKLQEQLKVGNELLVVARKL